MATAWTQPLEGIQERRLSTDFCHIRIHYTADPLKRGDWADRASVKFYGKDSARWQREQELNYRAYGGQRIWPMLSVKYHNALVDIKGLTLYRVVDQGIRHPTVCLWIAVNASGDRHIYREYYASDKSIAMNCRAILGLTPPDEKIKATLIDPATKKRNAETMKTMIAVYQENGLTCTGADNSFAGYDLVATSAMSTLARYGLAKGMLPAFLAEMKPSQTEVLALASKPALTFDLRMVSRCFEECRNLRWRETKIDESQTVQKEKPVDKDDDGPDCVRYAIATRLVYVRQPADTIRIGDYRVFEQKKQRAQSLEEVERRFERRGSYA